MCIFVGVCVCIHQLCEYEGQLSFSIVFYLLFWVRISQWTWNSLIELGWLVSEFQGSSLNSLSYLQHWNYRLPCSSYIKEVKNLNSSPCACITSTFLTELSPQPIIFKVVECVPNVQIMWGLEGIERVPKTGWLCIVYFSMGHWRVRLLLCYTRAWSISWDCYEWKDIL